MSEHAIGNTSTARNEGICAIARPTMIALDIG